MKSICSFFGVSERQFLTAAIFGVSNLFSATCVSIAAPFYPEEATLKGATAMEYGFVFGVFHLTLFIASPIYGILMGRISPTYLFNYGNVVLGFFCILFGFLTFVEDRTTFITLSFVLRILQALGHSANAAASFTIITIEFPSSFATCFAALETCYGLGLIVGPTTGGILYEVGGFILPFLTMGVLLMLTASVGTWLLTTVQIESISGSDYDNEAAVLAKSMNIVGAEMDFDKLNEELAFNSNSWACLNVEQEAQIYGVSKTFITTEEKMENHTFLSLLKVPGVALAGCGIAVSSCSIGFLQATLEPFLKEKFNVTPLYTGFVFMIDGLMYTCAAPLWGRLCDKWVANPKFITLAGCLLTFTGFLFIGPAPGVSSFLAPNLWLVCLGLVIHGLGMGASFVSAFIQAIKDSIASGFPDACATYGLVSGLWMSGFALGGCIGPSVGGLLLSYFSFSDSTIFVLVTQLLMAAATIIFITVQYKFTASEKSTSRKGSAHSNSDADETSSLLTHQKS